MEREVNDVIRLEERKVLFARDLPLFSASAICSLQTVVMGLSQTDNPVGHATLSVIDIDGHHLETCKLQCKDLQNQVLLKIGEHLKEGRKTAAIAVCQRADTSPEDVLAALHSPRPSMATPSPQTSREGSPGISPHVSQSNLAAEATRGHAHHRRTSYVPSPSPSPHEAEPKRPRRRSDELPESAASQRDRSSVPPVKSPSPQESPQHRRRSSVDLLRANRRSSVSSAGSGGSPDSRAAKSAHHLSNIATAQSLAHEMRRKLRLSSPPIGGTATSHGGVEIRLPGVMRRRRRFADASKQAFEHFDKSRQSLVSMSDTTHCELVQGIGHYGDRIGPNMCVLPANRFTHHAQNLPQQDGPSKTVDQAVPTELASASEEALANLSEDPHVRYAKRIQSMHESTELLEHEMVEKKGEAEGRESEEDLWEDSCGWTIKEEDSGSSSESNVSNGNRSAESESLKDEGDKLCPSATSHSRKDSQSLFKFTFPPSSSSARASAIEAKKEIEEQQRRDSDELADTSCSISISDLWRLADALTFMVSVHVIAPDQARPSVQLHFDFGRENDVDASHLYTADLRNSIFLYPWEEASGEAALTAARLITRFFKIEQAWPCPSVRFVPPREVIPTPARLASLSDYKKTVSAKEWDMLELLARRYRDSKMSALFFSSTPHGGGVALMRHALLRLYRLMGLRFHWLVIPPKEGIFEITKKKIHNVLQGVAPSSVSLNDADEKRLLDWGAENAGYFADLVKEAQVLIIDDYQPSSMIPHLRRLLPHLKIIYRCHIQIRTELMKENVNEQEEMRVEETAQKYMEKGAGDVLECACEIPSSAQQQQQQAPHKESEGTAVDHHDHDDQTLLQHGLGFQTDICNEKRNSIRRSWNYIWKNIHDSEMFISHPVREFVPNDVPLSKLVYAGATTDALDGLNKPMPLHILSFYFHKLNLALSMTEQTPLDHTRPYIVQVARFDPSKGLGDVLQAYRVLRKRLSADHHASGGNTPINLGDVDRTSFHCPGNKMPQLILCGHGAIDDPEGGPIYRKVLSIIQEDAGFADIKNDIKVIKLPNNDQILNAILRCSTVALQLSHSEGYEIKVSEALAKGVPVVAYKAGGIPLQIEDGKTGFLLEIGDVCGVANCLYKLLTDDALYEQVSNNALSAIRTDHFTVRNAINWITMSLIVQENCLDELVKECAPTGTSAAPEKTQLSDASDGAHVRKLVDAYLKRIIHH